MAYMIFLIFFVFGLITKLNTSRILAVFPVPSFSHQIVFRPITQELARRGHDVTVITSNPAFPKDLAPVNLTEIDVHYISYSAWAEEQKKMSIGSLKDMEALVKILNHFYLKLIKQQLFSKEVQDLIRNKETYFDLILVEACVRPALIYSYIYKAPVIQLNSFGLMFGTNTVVGASNHPLLQPIIVRQRLYNLTLWEKICGIYQQFKIEYIYSDYENEESNQFRRIFGMHVPSVGELLNNVDMFFSNVYAIWNDNSPVPPGVIYMGGVHQTLHVPNELPKDLRSYLDSSKNAVIYVSFGTNAPSSILPLSTIKMMINILSELPYDVILKWDTDLPDKPSNVKVFKWLPQIDLLKHPKVKLFIMQGGLQSTDEAITCGVPLIGIPLMADQWFNVEKYVLLGIGKQLEMGVFTEEDFRNAVVTVIENESYRNNILRLRNLMHDQPQTPLERAIWWMEYVLRHGGAKHLRSPAANMSWVDYYELDLAVITLMCLLIFIFTLKIIMCYIKRYIFRNISRAVKRLNFKILKLN